ncbi:MAG: hypothetical protein WCQ95_01455 [Bacteroidota bacterium]
MKRILITVKDIQILTGLSYQSAYRAMQHLRDALSKQKHQKVTIKEYTDYNGLKIDEVADVLDL